MPLPRPLSKLTRSEGRMRRFMGIVALAVIPPLMVLLTLAAKFHSLTIPQAIDQAQLARHLAVGEGFTTSVVRPLSLLFKADVVRHPDIYHAPLHPLLLSLAFNLVHPSDRVAAAATCLVWIASVWLTYAVARAWCTARVANLAALFYGSSVGALSAAVQSLPYALLSIGMLIAVWAAVPHPRMAEEDDQPERGDVSLWRVGLAGVVCAALFLTHYLMLVAAIALAGFLAFTQEKRGRAVATFVLSFLIPLLPWFVRNAVVIGAPFFSLYWYEILTGTTSYPGDSVWRTLIVPPAPFLFCIAHPLQMLRKLTLGLSGFRSTIFSVIDPFVAFMFLAGILSFSVHRRWRWVLGIVAGSALMAVFGSCLLRTEPGILLAWLPLLALVGAVQASNWIQRQLGRGIDLGRLSLSPKLGRIAAYVVIGGCTLFPMVQYFVLMPSEPPLPLVASIRSAAAQIPADARLMTDQPALLAWYGDRDAIELCQREQDIDRLERVIGPLDALLVTTAIVRLPVEERGDWWSWVLAPRGIYRGLVPAEHSPANASLRVRPKSTEATGS